MPEPAYAMQTMDRLRAEPPHVDYERSTVAKRPLKKRPSSIMMKPANSRASFNRAPWHAGRSSAHADEEVQSPAEDNSLPEALKIGDISGGKHSYTVKGITDTGAHVSVQVLLRQKAFFVSKVPPGFDTDKKNFVWQRQGGAVAAWKVLLEHMGGFTREGN